MIAKRKIPSAIKAPIIAPTTADIAEIVHPTNPMGGGPKNGKSQEHQRNKTPTIKPISINTAPTTLLLPDPK